MLTFDVCLKDPLSNMNQALNFICFLIGIFFNDVWVKSFPCDCELSNHDLSLVVLFATSVHMGDWVCLS